jgi:RecG-like helicase
MALKKMVERLTKPVEQQDREKLVQFCDALDVTHCDELTPRVHTRVAGEVASVRVVPRAGAPSLEVTVSDGRGSVVGVFFGRRKLAGLTPGRRLVLEGVVAPSGKRAYMYNPVYEFLT